MLFLGEHEHSLDPKRRLAIPADLRAVFEKLEPDGAVVVGPGPNDRLWIWTEQRFAELSGTFGGPLVSDEELAELQEDFFTNSARLTFDSAGRIRIPDRLLEDFGFVSDDEGERKRVAILGVRDHLELVDAEVWRARASLRKDNRGNLWRRARQTAREREQRAD